VLVLDEVDPSLSLDNAEAIYVNVVQDVVECGPSGETKKRHSSKINANRLLDDEIYDVMNDVPTRQFDFIVKPVDPSETRPGEHTNLFYAISYFVLYLFRCVP